METLPHEPTSLVEKYLAGRERPLKEQVIANRRTRYSSPAVSTTSAEVVSCSCKGKCATRACNCKGKDIDCTDACCCSEVKCKNRQLFCSNLHYNENSSRPQAKTVDGKLKWAISYPKAFKGEKAVAKPLKEKPTYGYVDLVFDEVVQLRLQYKTLKTAKQHAMETLPHEPTSLVEKYLAGRERPLKEQVIANRRTRYSSPAVSTTSAEVVSCSCKGKCATRACNCKGKDIDCTDACCCSEVKCKNRQ
ncbi:hypothetical protein AC249_AIPGENE8778 [Exaiptasia diaphana]|nr:hypothetical protein AC249_AIPGENE8778 [Exaiptasia diaphana]